MPPTFRTYNVALRYAVKYDVLLACGARESEHEVLVLDGRVEPMTRPGGWLGPPPEEDDGGFGEGEVLVELMRGGRGEGGGVEPPAYAP